MLKRALTAVIGIPAVILFINNSSEKAFFIFVLLTAAIALKEFFCMAQPDEGIWGKGLGILLGCIVLTSFFLDSHISPENSSSFYFLSAGACALSLITLFFYHFFFTGNKLKALDLIVVKIFGIFYIALLFSYVILIRALPDGVELVFFLIFITWAGDTGAYIIGSWIGKRALCPDISPKKTIEGAFGSAFFGILTAILFKMFFLKQMSILHCLMLGFGINIMNQFGDLSESMIKRSFGAKDSGSVLPGHGGMLDRIDSVLFAAPFLFYYIKTAMPGI